VKIMFASGRYTVAVRPARSALAFHRRAAVGQHEQAAAAASQAETVARSITDPGPQAQAQALTAVTEALAELSQHEQAETVARSITQPGWQAQALTVVAKALAAKGNTRQARHVASAACAVGQWTTVLELALSLEPSALRALTDLLLQSTEK
jgi:hypothetical protein